MSEQFQSKAAAFPAPRLAEGEAVLFRPGDRVRVQLRYPLGHYRAPWYIRGKTGVVESIIEPRAVNNEQAGFGRNAGSKRHRYRVVFSMMELWPGYQGSPLDDLGIEVFEAWLESV